MNLKHEGSNSEFLNLKSENLEASSTEETVKLEQHPKTSDSEAIKILPSLSIIAMPFNSDKDFPHFRIVCFAIHRNSPSNGPKQLRPSR